MTNEETVVAVEKLDVQKGDLVLVKSKMTASNAEGLSKALSKLAIEKGVLVVFMQPDESIETLGEEDLKRIGLVREGQKVA